MEFLVEVARWFGDAAHWRGPQGVLARVFEHTQICLLSLGIASAIALPAGTLIGHTRRGVFVVGSVANLGRTIPSFAILAIALPFTINAGLGLGFWPTVLTLVLLAIPPILTNTYVGIQSVEPDIVEAARGTGLSELGVLRRIEIALGARIIVSGLKTAAVQVIATATLAALVAWGGLGRFIIDGFATGDDVQIVAGALLVAGLAVLTELLFSGLERLVVPKTSP